MSELVLDDIAAGLTLGTMLDALNGLAGLDVDPTQATLLLNEGNRELTIRSEWRRGDIELGPTVAGQIAYEFPSTVSTLLNLSVNGQPYQSGAEQEIEDLRNGTLTFTGVGKYWTTFADTVESISLWPTPGVSGQSIAARALLYPPDLTEPEQEPVVPPEYRRAIVAYAAARAYEAEEDNPEMGDRYLGQFEDAVARLRLHRYSRQNRQPFTAKVVGRTA